MVLWEGDFLPSESQTKFGEGFINHVRWLQARTVRMIIVIAPPVSLLGKISSKHLTSLSGGGNGLILGITPWFVGSTLHTHGSLGLFKVERNNIEGRSSSSGVARDITSAACLCSCQLLLDNSCKKSCTKIFYPSFFWFMKHYNLLSLFIFLCRMEYLQ